tara:strand:- start:2223 stop:3158 length:936 start_codon:yes stop_codon:yes gene_type:complete
MSISVVVPTQNEEQTISQLIKSLLDQTLQPEEIIIVDGYSEDSTVQKVQDISKTNKKVKIFFRKKKCRGSGRNTGIKNAKGKFIALIDAGCTIENDWLEKFYLEKNFDIIFGVVKPYSKTLQDISYKSILISKTNYKELITPSVCSMLVKKSVFEKINFKESNDGSYLVEDLDFIDKILASNLKFKYSIDAIVSWKISSKWNKILSRHKEYSLGALKTKYFKIWYKGLFRNYIFFIIICFFSFFYSYYLLLLIFILALIKSYSYLNFLKNFRKISIYTKIKLIIINIFQFLLIDLASLISFVKFYFFKRLT